ncbi:hypothetical protein EDB84DRAFT_1583122, partial [Lactarius hengduanensis]
MTLQVPGLKTIFSRLHWSQEQYCPRLRCTCEPLHHMTVDHQHSFESTGKSTVISPSLDIGLNMDLATLFTATRLCAASAGLSTEKSDDIVQPGGYQYLQVRGGSSSGATEKRRDNLYTGCNLPNFVDAAFKQLHSDVQLEADVRIGDYTTTLQFTQPSVPTSTDQLLPLLAQPIVQKIVSGSTLGPWEASRSQTLTVGAQFEVEATFEIADDGHLTNFTKEPFDWVTSPAKILAAMSALGIIVPGILLPKKTATFKGLNNLKNGVLIKSFDLLANDPTGGIHLTLDTAITNVSLKVASFPLLLIETEGTAYDPSTSSNDATAAFTLPSNLPVDIKALGEKISVSTGGTPFSELTIPKGPAFTDVQQRIVHLTFSDVPFTGLGDQRGAFQQFLALTTSTNQTMGLSIYGCSLAVSAELQQVSGDRRVVRYKFAFQWCDGQGDPWWPQDTEHVSADTQAEASQNLVHEGESNDLSHGQFSTPGTRNYCSELSNELTGIPGHTQPMCLQPSCPQFSMPNPSASVTGDSTPSS